MRSNFRHAVPFEVRLHCLNICQAISHKAVCVITWLILCHFILCPLIWTHADMFRLTPVHFLQETQLFHLTLYHCEQGGNCSNIGRKRKPTQQCCSWARMPHNSNHNVVQDNSHTPANRLIGTPWFTASFFDTWHPHYGQLTPVHTKYLLTSIMWSYQGLKLRAHQGHMFFEVDYWPIAGFRFDLGLMSI